MVNLYRVVDNLIGLATKKYEQLQIILSLTKQQTVAIEETDMPKLMELIDKKQGCIDKISAFDKQFESITDDIKTLYDGKSLEDLELEDTNIAVLKDTVSNVTSLLKEILKIENDNKQKINESKQQLERKMKKARTGKAAMRQYHGISGYADAVFFDKKIK